MADVFTRDTAREVEEDSPTASLENLLKGIHGEKHKATDGLIMPTSDNKEQGDETIGAIDMEEIEVIDGMALLEESKDDYSRETSAMETSEVVLESGVEVGSPLPPSKHKIRASVPVSGAKVVKNSVPTLTFPFDHVDGNYLIDKNLTINHNELEIGGDVPQNRVLKDDLINRLRLFISKLYEHLEQSEGSTNALKQEYSKKIHEVKESEQLIAQLTGQITEQAKAVSEQLREVQVARESAKKQRQENVIRVEKNNAAALSQIPESYVNQIHIDNGFGEKNVGNDDMNDDAIIDKILQKDSFPGLTYKLTIKKPPLGFTVMTEDGARFPKVERVSRNDLKKAGLEAGLEIMDVNNLSLKNMTAQEVVDAIESRMASSVEIRMRKALIPWTKNTTFSTTSWGTKKAKTTWTLYCTRNKPRIVVLEHNQRKGKSKRKVTIDGEIRYERKSAQELFKISLESDVLMLMIEKESGSGYEYTMQINNLSFSQARKSFIQGRKVIMGVV